MKTIILSTLLLSFVVGCSRPASRNDYKEWHDTNYRVENGAEVKVGESKIVQEFDGQGRVNKIIYYNDGVTLSSYSEVFRNSTNNIITQKSFDASGTLERSSVGLWLDDKYVWSKGYSAEGKLTLETKYKYDAQGRTLEQKFYNGEGVFLNGYKCEYDDPNNSSSEMLFKSDGSLDFRKIVYKFNEDGLKVERIHYWKGKAYEITTYNYVDGNCTSETKSDPREKVFYQIRTDYNKNGTRKVRRKFKPSEETGELNLVEITKSKVKY